MVARTCAYGVPNRAGKMGRNGAPRLCASGSGKCKKKNGGTYRFLHWVLEFEPERDPQGRRNRRSEMCGSLKLLITIQRHNYGNPMAHSQINVWCYIARQRSVFNVSTLHDDTIAKLTEQIYDKHRLYFTQLRLCLSGLTLTKVRYIMTPMRTLIY